MNVAWVLLTTGGRREELLRAVESVLTNVPAPVEVVVVGNGHDPAADGLPAGVRTVALEANVGIPAGRNRGVDACSADIVAFLDDDAAVVGADGTGVIAALFEADPLLAVASFRINDPVSGATMQRHVPTVGGHEPGRSREVTTFLGGACAIRRDAYLKAGGLPEPFFYAHEETDLAWRLLDAGLTVRYSPEVVVTHPATSPGRHAMAARLTARNRVWLARRRLPWVLAPVYVGVWIVLTAVRRSFPARPFAAGLWEGVRTPCPPRRPMGWSTVLRMTRMGRPPII